MEYLPLSYREYNKLPFSDKSGINAPPVTLVTYPSVESIGLVIYKL